jgi:transposase
MDRFPTTHHLASWAEMAPGNHKSAGKRKSGKTTQGNKKLRSCLIETAQAAARSKKTYFHSHYHRIGARRGKKRAAVAVGHSILIIIYYMLKRKEPYQELGPDYFEKRHEASNVSRAVKKLEKLGYKVTVEKQTA